MFGQVDPLEVIAQNTIGVLTTLPQKRDEWLQAVQQIRAQAQAAGDAPMVALLDAVHRLLMGEKFKAIRPSLSGSHAKCWARIGDGLKNPPQFDPRAQAVSDFINTGDLEEKKRIVQQHRSLLLTDAADNIFAALIAQYRNDPNTLENVIQHRDLLHQCRVNGIDAAFTNVAHPVSEELDHILGELDRPTRSPQEMPHRIDLIRRALELLPRGDNPKIWGMLQTDLAGSLSQSPLGDRAENIEEAIRCSRQALEVRTREAMPVDWASTMMNLGVIYSERMAGDRAENLEEAIRCLQQALEVRTREAMPTDWAKTTRNLGTVYRRRIRGDHAQNTEEAIQYFQQALAVYTRSAFPREWAETNSNLGFSYFERTLGDRAGNLDQAIHFFSQALVVMTRETTPVEWAKTMMSLGAAYGSHLYGNRAENLEESIRCCREAMQVVTRVHAPADWARINMNLGLTYANRVYEDRAENLELAIHFSRQALEVMTHEAMPIEWAKATSNLGLAYRSRIRGDKAENIEQAIHCYRQGLEAISPQTMPVDWALMMTNLGNAYANRILEDAAENKEQAIDCYTQALGGLTPEDRPLDWANTMMNLATAYDSRLHGAPRENFEQAIEHYQQALKVFTQDLTPFNWAATQMGLGNVYSQRIAGEHAHNIEQAIYHYQQALKVFTREALPSEHRRTQRSLGYLNFDEQHWMPAWEAYNAAIEAGDDLLIASHTEAGRRAEVGETAQLYAHAAYCLLQLDRPADALLMLERGKTRLLAEALSLVDVDLNMLPESVQEQVQKLRQTLRDLEAEMRLPLDSPGRRDDRELADRLHSSRMDLRKWVEAIRKDHPDFMPQGLELSDLLALIPEGGVLVAPFVTSQGGAAFILPHGVRKITDDHVLWLGEFDEQNLNGLLHGNVMGPGWLRLYSIYSRAADQAEKDAVYEAWFERMEPTLASLWKMLIGPICERINEFHVERGCPLILMPAGGMQLLPFHATWHSENGTKCALIEDYEVIYAPSGYALQVSQHRVPDRTGTSALVVGIDTYEDPGIPPLIYAGIEADKVGHVLGADPRVDAAATRQAITEGAAGSAFLHLSCHGHFAWGDPLASGLICYDGPLTLSDIIGKLNLDSCRLVTLSACETGITDVSRSPDEYVGLPAGFLQAGAPAVVSTLWAVDDRSTSLLMERFYTNLHKNGMPPAAALREAQLWMRSGGAGEDYTHPYYWAAFTFTGA